FTPAWTSLTAAESTVLFTVSDVISRDSRIGTPDRMSTPSVLEKRVSAVLWTSLPNTGALSLTRSHTARPLSVWIQRRKAQMATTTRTMTTGKNFLNIVEMLISTRVSTGSVPPSWA